MRGRVLTAAACMAFATALMAPVAVADPSNAKNATQISAICSGHSIMVVVHGNGEVTPAPVVGSTAMFLPQAFHTSVTFTPTRGSPMSETDTSSKAAAVANAT